MDAKKVIGIVIALVLAATGGFYLKSRVGGTNNVLRLYTWSDYFPESVLHDFTQKTGIKVEVSYLSSNEEMFAKMRAGAAGFDVIQPSDYMVARLVKLAMLQPLDHRKLPNLSHLDDYYRTLPYDDGLRHSIPFTWGTTGIAINTAKVKVPADGVSWKMLAQSPDPTHTSIMDDMREVFTAMLRWRGHSLNSTAMNELEGAKRDIVQAKSRILTFSSEPVPLLLREEIHIAHIFSYDALRAHAKNGSIQYFIPKEGGTVWTDNLAIPTTSRNPEAAHAFLDYILDPENALKILRENRLPTPNRTARAALPAEERDDPTIYPPKEVMDRMEFIRDIDETLPVMNRMWTELKS